MECSTLQQKTKSYLQYLFFHSFNKSFSQECILQQKIRIFCKMTRINLQCKRQLSNSIKVKKAKMVLNFIFIDLILCMRTFWNYQNFGCTTILTFRLGFLNRNFKNQTSKLNLWRMEAIYGKVASWIMNFQQMNRKFQC